MKKLLSIVLVLSMCLSLSIGAAASYSTSEDKALNIWVSMRESGKLFVNENGLLELNADNEFSEKEGYDYFLHLVDVSNESIVDGILVADKETAFLESTSDWDNDLLLQIKESVEENSNNEDQPIEITPARAGNHGCSLPFINILNLCAANRSALENYHHEMVMLATVNPGMDGWRETLDWWMLKLQDNGEWDYKTNPLYQGNFCSYFQGEFHHIDGEYLGNFNYGYTGSYLFGLSVLHIGSWVVSGFNPADEYTDWPAIDAGYYSSK